MLYSVGLTRLATLFAALVFTGAVQAQDVRDTVKETFKVRPGGTLFIDVDHGNVEIESTRDAAVRIEVERRVEVDNRDEAKELLEMHDLTIRQNGNNVSVESRFGRSGDSFWGRMRRHANVRVRVYVQVPQSYNVDFSSGAGNVRIANLNGDVRGRTGAGNIAIGAASGTVEVSSGSGNIEIEGATGLVDASTGAGNVDVRDVRGEVQIGTGAGNITAHISEQPRSASNLKTGAGNVTVYLDRSVGVDVVAEASMGSASTDYPLRVEGKWMRKSFEGRVNGGGPDLYMRAGVGNVSLKRM